MNLADLGWSSLIYFLQEDLRSRSGQRSSVRREMYDAAWGEFRTRLLNLARVLSRRHQSVFRRSLIDDVVQQVILRLQSEEMMSRVAAADSPPSYLAGILRNALTDADRVIALNDRRLSDIASPMVAFDKQYETVELQRSLSILAPDERHLIELRFWRGLTISDIAAELNISYSAAAMRIVRLLAKLRQAM